MDIITKLKNSKLTGRGGAGFPTWQKWEMVKKEKAEKKFVVCNGSEGEPGVKKDGYILEHYPDEVIKGIKTAIDYLGAVAGYLFINQELFKKFGNFLDKKLDGTKIELVRKPHGAGYIGGEETALLNAIEGARIEPRLKPPFPTVSGLWGYPTLINNVETFYDISLIMEGKYKNRRFYTINGDCLWTGVYELFENYSIEQVLKETKNYPDFDFFVQVGGDASGEILNSKQLKQLAKGAGSITVYSVLKHTPIDLMKKWIDFFLKESCGQCTPCREGMYRLKELINQKDPDMSLFFDLLKNLQDTSFCALGSSLPYPIESLLTNVSSVYPQFNGIKN